MTRRWQCNVTHDHILRFSSRVSWTFGEAKNFTTIKLLCSLNQGIQVSSIPNKETENIKIYIISKIFQKCQESSLIPKSLVMAHCTMSSIFSRFQESPNIVLNGNKNVAFNAYWSVNKGRFFKLEITKRLILITLELSVFEYCQFNWTRKEIKGFNYDDILTLFFPLELEQIA